MFFNLRILIVCTLYVIKINAECDICGKSGIACISENQYRNCTIDGVMDETTFNECPLGQYCDENEFCASTATCEISSRYLARAVTATSLCVGKRIGRYVIAGTSCLTYVNCYIYNATILGIYHNCPGSTLFNDNIGICDNPLFFTCLL